MTGESVSTTVSLGVTLLDPTEHEALDRALARADQALYDAKDNGRNRTSVSIAELQGTGPARTHAVSRNRGMEVP